MTDNNFFSHRATICCNLGRSCRFGSLSSFLEIISATKRRMKTSGCKLEVV
ncbi:hypothetical protein SJAG_03830 [Schizosaccharomyces japonicus yFS275]|uniref:Uncharacterized protein n=1 Tax=Schizosaccharomyces japonicus (strain yFS275 / FY16936) TaxID=402676 RepID=B6K562_SCHJY|nr:hypothetical protein SJAG_03830 [Schizosaccharomyces japonicus yFS275]EEB08666.1 hypothetical protein SJAG_03830 [Schizosaccharomyces japonicus yFS275]